MIYRIKLLRICKNNSVSWPVLQFGTIFLLSLPHKANTMDEELEREATCAKIAQVHKEGKRMVKVLVNLINQKN